MPAFARGVTNLIISIILVQVCLSSLSVQIGYRISSEKTAAHVNLESEHQSPLSTKTAANVSLEKGHQSPLSTLIGFPRTLWASGYTARAFPDQDASLNDACGVWTWTAETEKVFASHYRVTMFEGVCESSGSLVLGNAPYGHASRLRDIGGFLLDGVLSNRRVIHAGKQMCPKNPEADPMMWCQFSRMSSCPGVQKYGKAKAMDESFEHNVDWFTGIGKRKNATGAKVTFKPGAELWQKLVQNGLKNIVRDKSKCDRRKASMDGASRRLGILRSLLMSTSLLPAAELQFERDALGQRLSPPAGAMIVIHVRRTDKRADNAKLQLHETKPDPTESIVAFKELIKIAERLSGELFESIFVMSDDPAYYSADVLKALSSAGSRFPKVLVDESIPKYLETVLQSTKSYNWYRHMGHTVLPAKHRDWLTRQMFAGVYFAGKRGSFVIGNGKSGVTQLVAQLIGASRRVDPNAVALYEDDPVLLKAFNETRNLTF